MKMRIRWLVLVGLLLLVLVGVRLAADSPDPLLDTGLVQTPVAERPGIVPGSGGPAAPAGFARADGPRTWDFPADFGPHPEYQTEWWYYTGTLETAGGRLFGYQLTLFQRGLVPPAERTERRSDWAADQIYMGHFALSDIQAGTHRSYETFSRGAAGLAGARNRPFQVWVENWSIEMTGPETFRLRAEAEDAAVDLVLEDRKGPVFHGEAGYSRKGEDPGNASYYFSQTRLASAGEVRSGKERFRVEGLSWMDHEFSTSALAPGQIGWDWFSLQLENGTDLMVFQIRRGDGSTSPYSSGTLIEPDGGTRALEREDFEIEVTGTWRSPRSGAVYPSGWKIRVPEADLALEVEPLLEDQEMDVSYQYWEGAVSVSGQSGENAVSGKGYVELTGYAGSLEGEF